MKQHVLLRVLSAEADRDALRPILDALREKGLRTADAEGSLRKGEILLAALSEHFYTDGEKQKTLLEALSTGAENVLPLSGLVCPVMDARRGEVYAALFEARDGKTARLSPDAALPASELAALVARNYPGRPVMLVGDGVEVAAPAFRDAGIELVALPDVLLPHSAVSCGRVALREVEEAGAVDGEELAPTYLRESQAETTRRFGGK